MKLPLRQTIRQSTFLLDGGTGEELFAHGVLDDRKIWSATAVVQPEYHATLKNVHKSFLDAGADAITTNTYGIIPGVGFEMDEITLLCDTAGQLARQVVDGYSNKYVLGSLGPLVESYRPDMIMEHAKGVGYYTTMVQALQPHVDGFIAETLSSVEESMQPLEAISKTCPEIPLLVSYTLNEKGELRSNESADLAIHRLLDEVQKTGNIELLAILFNCCEPESVTKAFHRIHQDTKLVQRLKDSSCRLGAYANRLTAVDPNWTMADSTQAQPFRTDLDPHEYCHDYCAPWIQQYPTVSMVGGCCGISPAHIVHLHKELKR